jgi:hypothetical protein
VPIQLTNVPKETTSVSVLCAVQGADGAPRTAWARVPVSSPATNGQGIDWSATATVNITLGAQTLGEAQARYKTWRCELALNFESLGMYYPPDFSLSPTASQALPQGVRTKTDIPLAKNSPQQVVITGTLAW